MFKTGIEIQEFLERQKELYPKLNQYPICIEEVNDGDIWHRITIPMDGITGTIAHAVVEFLTNIIAWCPRLQIFVEPKNVIVGIYEHACDPG